MGALEVAARTEWLGSKLPKDKIQLRLTHIPQTLSILKSWLSGRYFWNIIFVFFSSFCGEDYGGYSRRYQSPRWALISIRGSTVPSPSLKLVHLSLVHCQSEETKLSILLGFSLLFSFVENFERKTMGIYFWDWICKRLQKINQFLLTKKLARYWPFVEGYRPNPWVGYTSVPFP